MEMLVSRTLCTVALVVAALTCLEACCVSASSPWQGAEVSPELNKLIDSTQIPASNSKKALSSQLQTVPPPPPVLQQEPGRSIGDRAQFVAEPWETVANLTNPTVFSSIIFLNNTFIAVGGCVNANCTNISDTMQSYAPSGQVVTQPYPRLGIPLAGQSAAVAIGSNIYIFPMCSFHFGDPRDLNETDIQNLRNISEVNMDQFALNTSFFTVPTESVRVNATCITFGTSVYIIGGVKVGAPRSNVNEYPAYATAVDVFDLLTATFQAGVEELVMPVRNAAVTKDSAGIYVIGGISDEHGSVSRFVQAIYVDDASGGICTITLPFLPNEKRLLENHDLQALAYAGYLVVGNYNRSVMAVIDLQEKTERLRHWNIFDVRAQGNASDGEFNKTYSSYATWTSMPMNFGYNGSSLVLLKFGGVYSQTINISSNETEEVDLISDLVTVSVTNVEVPSVIMSEITGSIVAGSVFRLPMGDNNATIDTECKGLHSPCSIRLSARIDCGGNAAGTTNYAPWVAGQSADFIATSAADPVYVCFSSGMSAVHCKNSYYPQIFSVTDALNPLQINTMPTEAPNATTIAPTPTATPNPTNSTESPGTPSPDDGGGSGGGGASMLLYILGAVAALTSIVAVLLVAKLRRGVPEEGLLTRGGNQSQAGLAGYSTMQDERYKVISKIGEGAFSIVFLVIRRHDGAKFAMKHMECQSDLQRQEAIKECEIMRSLQGHPNVINLVDMFMNYEFDTATTAAPTLSNIQSSLNDKAAAAAKQQLQEGFLSSSGSPTSPKKSRHLCLVMEYHPAGDLRKWALRLPAHPAEPILCSVAFQICSVLKHIHSQEPAVIHRDLKPENILISAGGAPHPTFLPVVVTDFGLARMQEESFCRSGAGTLPYVAPECFKKRYTTQCDMWGLGCVLYAIATKRVNNDNVRLMFQDCTRPNFQDEIRSDLVACEYSNQFINFVQHLLVVQPEGRLTAPQAFKLFRKKGELVYISSKLGAPPSPTAHAGTNTHANGSAVPSAAELERRRRQANISRSGAGTGPTMSTAGLYPSSHGQVAPSGSTKGRPVSNVSHPSSTAASPSSAGIPPPPVPVTSSSSGGPFSTSNKMRSGLGGGGGANNTSSTLNGTVSSMHGSARPHGEGTNYTNGGDSNGSAEEQQHSTPPKSSEREWP